MSTQPTPTDQQLPSGSDGRGPHWLGWIVIAVVAAMMVFAIVVSFQRMKGTPMVAAPTLPPKERIGSIEVASQALSPQGTATESNTGDQDESTDVDTVAESAAAEDEKPTSGTNVATSGQTGTLRIADGAGEDPNRELLVPGPIIVIAPTPATVAGLPYVPTATSDARTGRADAENVSTLRATGQARTRSDATQTAGTPQQAATASPTRALTNTRTPTEPPTATATALPSQTPTQTFTQTPTDAPTTTPTGTPTVTSTATPVPTVTSMASPTPAPTQTPTETGTATPTMAETGTPAAMPTVPVEDLPVQVPPGGRVAVKLASLLMRLDASPSAGVMETYAKGATFDVLEPVDPFDSYPAEAGGISWLRVRAQDGLVGWINASHVSIAN